MRLIHVGQGPHTGMWRAATARHSGLTPVATVGHVGQGAELPGFDDLGAALDAVQADAVVLDGAAGGDPAAEAIGAGLALIVAEPRALTVAQLSALRQAGAGARSVCLQPYLYRRCEAAMGRYLASGRLGAIGHVSCEDRRGLDLEGDGPEEQWLAVGVGHLMGVCRLLGSDAAGVMARFSRGPGQSASEAFVTLKNGLRVQYYGSCNTGQNGHGLWIEGAEGSLKTDGRWVLWRKRGWRFFAPVHFALGSKAVSPKRLLDDALTRIGPSAAAAGAQWAQLAAHGMESAQRGRNLDIQGGNR